VPDLLKEFDLSGTAVGAVEASKIVDGRKARPGDVLIGLGSSGVHCNGFTLVRKCVEAEGLSYRRAVAGLGKRSLGLELLTPTRLYVRPIMELLSKVRPTGMANITGGGFRNLMRINKALGFDIDRPPKPQRIFGLLQEWGEVSDREMYQTFNMGLGLAVLVRPADEAEALRVLRGRVPAEVVGTATKGGGVRVAGVKGVSFERY
jgi:phosphoribosylformylglycinamidine cyclo-ligase